MNLEQLFVGIFVAINVLSLLVIFNDKCRSMSGGNTQRTPEGLRFFMTTIFGAAGVYAGMLTFRNKTKKWYWKLGIPLFIFQNLATPM
jgi:uncharacterized membrane protein YsdA (DUF1294 family)